MKTARRSMGRSRRWRRCSAPSPLAQGRPGKRKVAQTEMQLACVPSFVVMAGLVPAIHAAPLQTNFYAGGGFGAWMPGTRPRLSGSANPVVNFKSHTTPARRARACPGHPRRAEAANFESFLQRHGVDGRDKPGLDAERF